MEPRVNLINDPGQTVSSPPGRNLIEPEWTSIQSACKSVMNPVDVYNCNILIRIFCSTSSIIILPIEKKELFEFRSLRNVDAIYKNILYIPSCDFSYFGYFSWMERIYLQSLFAMKN